MANESRVFRLPAGMSTQVVANAVEAFLSSTKGMEVQSAETTEGYVVQGRQEKDGWKTIAGMRMAIVLIIAVVFFCISHKIAVMAYQKKDIT